MASQLPILRPSFKVSLALGTAVLGLPWWLSGKEPAMQEPWEMRVQSLGLEDPLEEGTQPTTVFLPGEAQRQRGW